MDRNITVYAYLHDLSNAFDLVCYDIQWLKLNDICMPTELIDILKYWHHNQVNVVKDELAKFPSHICWIAW